MADWLGISYTKSYSLIYGDLDVKEKYSWYYGKPWAEVNAQDVIAKLEELLETQS